MVLEVEVSADEPDVDVLEVDDEPDPFEELDDSLEFEEPLELDESELSEEESPPDDVLDDEPRLSVLKKPEPLNVTPTGWNTFFTARTSPESAWVYSVRVSSVNACCTSMVSPVSTNL